MVSVKAGLTQMATNNRGLVVVMVNSRPSMIVGDPDEI